MRLPRPATFTQPEDRADPGHYAADVLEVENADQMVRVVCSLAGDVRGAFDCPCF